MATSCQRRLRRLKFIWIAFLLTIPCVLSTKAVHAASKEKSKIPVVRWDEARPGCTFSRSDDGRYYYSLQYEDLRISLAVDSQELEKVHRRHEPFFAVLLSLRYKGRGTLDLVVEDISLEFVRHFQVIQPALDPNGFSQKVQNDADELDYESARELKKHPEQKEEREAYMRAFQKDVAELQEFLGKNSLRPAQLNANNSEASGWVLFSTQSKWISGWKKPEEFILRVPMAGKIFEFPFKLPPKSGEEMLRRRE